LSPRARVLLLNNDPLERMTLAKSGSFLNLERRDIKRNYKRLQKDLGDFIFRGLFYASHGVRISFAHSRFSLYHSTSFVTPARMSNCGSQPRIFPALVTSA